MDVLRWWFDSALNFAPHLLIASSSLAALSAFERQWMLALPLALVAVALGAWRASGGPVVVGPVGLRLAHILVRGLAVRDVVTVPISDHRALVVGVALPEAQRE